MPSLSTITYVALVAMALLFAAGNIWFTATRSTIPLALGGVITVKNVRHEKHPPKDDVCLISLEPAAHMQIDQGLFDQVSEGDRLVKDAWSRRLQRNSEEIELQWSSDARGMAWAMPTVLAVLVAAFIVNRGRLDGAALSARG